jgi:hypothetical protein
MYANIDKHDVKALNRLDKRRKMKYHAKELRAAREEVEAPEGRYEDELSRLDDSYSPRYR